MRIMGGRNDSGDFRSKESMVSFKLGDAMEKNMRGRKVGRCSRNIIDTRRIKRRRRISGRHGREAKKLCANQNKAMAKTESEEERDGR